MMARSAPIVAKGRRSLVVVLKPKPATQPFIVACRVQGLVVSNLLKIFADPATSSSLVLFSLGPAGAASQAT